MTEEKKPPPIHVETIVATIEVIFLLDFKPRIILRIKKAKNII